MAIADGIVVDAEDNVGTEVDITRAWVDLGADRLVNEAYGDGSIYLAVSPPTRNGGFPSDDFGWTGGYKSITWYLDTDVDGATDYEIKFTGNRWEDSPYIQLVEVTDDGGAPVPCSATWT